MDIPPRDLHEQRRRVSGTVFADVQHVQVDERGDRRRQRLKIIVAQTQVAQAVTVKQRNRQVADLATHRAAPTNTINSHPTP